MHLILAVDTYPELHEDFLRWLKQREYDVPGCAWKHPKVREIKLYEITIPEQAEEKIVSELKYFERNSLGESLKKIIRNRFIMFLLKQLKIEMPKDVEAAKRDDVVPYKHWYISIIGKRKDIYREKHPGIVREGL